MTSGSSIPVERDPARAAALLDSGAMVLLPTETVYGLAVGVGRAAGAGSLAAFRAAREALSGRAMGSTASCWHAPSVASVLEGLAIKDAVHTRLIRKLAPGPVTFAVEVEPAQRSDIAARVGAADATSFMDERTALVRVPGDETALRVLAVAHGPVIAEAVPIAPGRDAASEFTDALRAAERAGIKIAAAIDGGRTALGKPSALVRLSSGGAWELEHNGPLDREYVARQVERRVLFVCTGNTCRSPMAEAIARGLLGGKAGTSVSSAGVGAADGARYSAQAGPALRSLGLEPPRGSSRALDRSMVGGADEIYVMTRSHRAAVLAMDPGAAGKVHLLDPAGKDVPDPIGAGQERYDQVALEMKRMIQERLEEPGQ